MWRCHSAHSGRLECQARWLPENVARASSVLFVPAPNRSRSLGPAWPGRDVLMPCDVFNGVALFDVLAERCQGLVLRGFERKPFKAFQFNANRVIVALAAATVGRLASMPGPKITVHKLPKGAGAVNEEMRRNGYTTDALIVGVCVPVQRVGE